MRAVDPQNTSHRTRAMGWQYTYKALAGGVGPLPTVTEHTMIFTLGH